MGIWGTNIYQNDISMDVKDDAIKLFQKGKNSEEITQELLKEWSCIMGNADEEPLFWLALADTLWKRGIMTEYVKNQTLNCIDMGADVKRWESIDPKLAIKRQKAIDLLKEQILSPQPPEKKPRIVKLYKCEWNIGDVFAYKMESESAKKKGCYGKYLLVQKVDEGIWYPGHIIPIVYVKITKTEELPQTVEEYDKLEYIQVWSYKYEQRFWPINGADAIGDIARKSKIVYGVDEYGYLPVYRVSLINSSKRVIPKTLIYLGNFVDAKLPKNEFIPHDKINIHAVSWKKHEQTFDSKMLKYYESFNLRKSAIYGNQSGDGSKPLKK